MNYKVFMKIFFEKPKYFLIYGLLMTTFYFILFFGINLTIYTAHYEKMTPDIEITGKKLEFENGNLLYQPIDSSFLDDIVFHDTKIYGVLIRNFYTFSDANYDVAYRIYGFEDELLHELEDYLKIGNLPQKGKREAVIGSNFAKYLNVSVGNAVNIPITLESDRIVEYEYIISGIINREMTFYNDGIYLSKLYLEEENDVLYVYTKNNKAYEEIKNQLENVEQDKIENILFHKEDKVVFLKVIVKSLIETIPFSAVFLIALFVSLMKYTGRKIALMKALGLSDLNIINILAKCFGVFNLCGILNSFNAMGLMILVTGISFPISVWIFTICSYSIILIVTIIILFIMCKSILPSKAMYQY